MRLATWGARRVLGTTAALSLSAMVLVAGGSAARMPESAETEGVQKSYWTPMSLRDGLTTVVVQFAGDPVAVVQGKADRELSKSEKAAIKFRLQTNQNSVRGAIQQLGGSVLADYQAAYNGLKVRIDRSKAAELGKLAGVVAVRPLQVMTRDNTRGVALIGTPAVWDGVDGLRGEDVKIAVLDTGIDYTHANFGGPGTTAAFDAADAADTLPADSSLFGPAAPRIKGGIDLVGDDYNASADPGDPALTPHPDPNPLDCNGHGTHVAGTAGGSGVLADGSTYEGDYDASTISGNSWTVGPGVAPKADLYAVRVFGCAGSTDVTVDAIEWAVDNDMDVINMSLGSSFGSNDDPSAVASTNAASAGVIVVASAGNSGPNQYITGSPASAEGAISVAASDPIVSSPGAKLVLSTGQTITVLNANNATFTDGTVYPVAVLRDSYPSGPVALGCAQSEYDAYPGSLAGKLVVTRRDTCSRVARAIFAQRKGAAAAAMINNTTAYPPFEGPITGSEETGPENVTIPFFGVKGLASSSTSDGGKLRLADGGTATATNVSLVNTNYKGFASFSSGGPRIGDSFLKPDITAPGVSITSALVGSGNGPLTISGTSMAAPHVAGVAALTRQAHPDWDPDDLKAAIVNTGDPAGVLVNRISRGGTGLVQPQSSTTTQVVAMESGGSLAISVSYGFKELLTDFSESREITLSNNGSSAATFTVAPANPAGSPHSVALSTTSVLVPAGGSAKVTMTLTVPAATVGSSSSGLAFREVAGLITFTPASGSDNNGVALRVPYYMVPRSLSQVDVALGTSSRLRRGMMETSATVTNPGGARSGDADFYAWGLSDPNETGNTPADIRAVGVQSFLASDIFGGFAQPDERFLVFAVNTHDRWSNAATNEFDIAIDVDRDKKVDYFVVGVDQGAVLSGSFNGRMAAFVFSTRSPGASMFFLAADPTNSSTVLLPILGRQLCRAGEPCLSPNKRLSYEATGFDLLDGSVDQVDGSAQYNAYKPVVGEGAFATAAPNMTTTVPLSIDVGEFFAAKPLGLMVVSLDNASGAAEAKLLPVKFGR